MIKIHSELPYKNLLVGISLLTASYLLLNTIGPQFLQKISFVAILLTAVFVLVKEIVSHFDKSALKLILVIQLVTLAILVPNIYKAELWGDEIGVIMFAEMPFAQVVQATKWHAVVPPFDYWMLHTWMKSLQFLEIPPYYNEVVYRLPYFFIHILSSLFFALLIDHWLKKHRFVDFIIFRKKSLQENTLPIVAALFFFFNPTLLFYGLEIRYFATAILGIVVTLYLFSKNKFNLPSSLLLMIVFSLNSVYHFIFMAPLLLIHFWKNRKIESVVLIAFMGLIFLQISPLLNYYENIAITASESLERIKIAFIELHQDFFVRVEHLVTLLIALGLYVVNRKRKKDVLAILFFIAYLFVAVAVPSYLKRYFDFHFRHFLVVTPFYVILFFYPLQVLKSDKSKKLFIGWLIFLIALWVGNIFTLKPSFPSKTNLGAKKMLQNIKYQPSLMVYFEPNLEQSVLPFNKFAYEWYKKKFELESAVVITENIICENPCLDQNRCVVLAGKTPVNCLNLSGFYHEETEFTNYYYSPNYFNRQ